MNERTVRRAREVRRRARQYRRRREGRLNGALSVCSLLLLTGIGTLCRDAQTPGLALAAQGFGSVLLRRGAGRYAVIGIAAFAAARALTIVCVRRRKRRTDRTSAAEGKRGDSMKTRLLSMLLSLCMALTMFPAGAFAAQPEQEQLYAQMLELVWSTGTAH